MKKTSRDLRCTVCALALGLGISSLSSLAQGQNAATAAGQGIPERPEKLTFPPLVYEPPAPEQYRVPLKSGPVAYVVPDRELPLVNVVVYVRTGQYVEPDGKQGLAELTGYLLARGGTQSKTAEALEDRLAFLAAHLDSAVGETQGSVSLNLLSKDLDEGLAILRDVLASPRFQEDKITLRKQQMLQAMKQRNDDTRAIEAREIGFLAFGEHFWANRYSTAESVDSLQQSDLKDFQQKWFHPQNFVVAASGDFDRDEMVKKLEALFGSWPFPGQMPPQIPTNTEFAAAAAYMVDKDVNQGRVAMMQPGILRDDPDYFPAIILNDILGGGGFTSRLVNRIRSDEGLAYDVHSSFPGGIYYPLPFTVGFQSKSRTVPFAASIVEEEMEKMIKEPVTDQELDASKQGFIERFPRNFATKNQIAITFAQDEFTGRYAKQPDYWKRYRARIGAVTKDDIARVATTRIKPKRLVILVVGNKSEILKGQPGHEANLPQLAGGRLVDVPLRDPLTMKPLPK